MVTMTSMGERIEVALKLGSAGNALRGGTNHSLQSAVQCRAFVGHSLAAKAMRFARTTKVLAKCVLKYYKTS